MLRRTGSVDIVTEYSLSAYFFRERGVDGLVRLLVLHHDEVGELILGFEELTLDSAPSITLSTYVAEPRIPHRGAAAVAGGMDRRLRARTPAWVTPATSTTSLTTSGSTPKNWWTTMLRMPGRVVPRATGPAIHSVARAHFASLAITDSMTGGPDDSLS